MQKHASLVNGIVYDIGVSSMQLDNKERGFSFESNHALDMRMDRNQALTAEHVVNTYTQEQLADILYYYGGERKSRAIASKIVYTRGATPITTTKQLRDIIIAAVGRYNDKIDPATRSFQALRIEVNDELKQLEQSLHDAAGLLKKGGKLIVVTFHSGEDRIVKKIFNQLCGKTQEVWPIMMQEQRADATFKKLHGKVITASAQEVQQNPRARSAKLRAIQKITEA